jgi:hypothetical protein
MKRHDCTPFLSQTVHDMDGKLASSASVPGIKLLRKLAEDADTERKVGTLQPAVGRLSLHVTHALPCSQTRSQQLIMACRGGNLGAVLRLVSNVRALDLTATDKVRTWLPL